MRDTSVPGTSETDADGEGRITVAWSAEPGLASDAELARAAELALRHGERSGEVLSLVIVTDEELADLHERFLDDPSPTDVISFDLGEGPGPMGEVYVSIDRARAVAEERGIDAAQELLLYVVHGTLHLCGFDDHEDVERVRMQAAEDVVMRALGFTRARN